MERGYEESAVVFREGFTSFGEEVHKRKVTNCLQRKCKSCHGYLSKKEVIYCEGCAKIVDSKRIKRVRNKNKVVKMPNWIRDEIKQGSKEYQCLCANCNWIKRGVNHEV